MSNTADYREVHMSAQVAEGYDKVLFAEGSFANLVWLREQEFLRKVLNEHRAKLEHIDYLDFACGTGRIIAFVEPMVDNATGLDISQAMLDGARHVVRCATLQRGDITSDDSLAPGPFDLITAFRFVLNAQPPLRKQVLMTLSRRLRGPGSILIFNMHGNRWSYLALRILLDAVCFWKKRSGERNYMSIRECRRLADECGLTIERIGVDGFVSPIALRVLPFRACLWLDRAIGRIPLLNRLGMDVVLVCRRAPHLQASSAILSSGRMDAT